MKLREIRDLLNAEVLSGHDNLDREVTTACASDLMSDVLSALLDDKTLLLTGLANTHAVRTAEMMDIHAIVFVRGKNPDDETTMMAEENGIVIMKTDIIMFVAAGILYKEGLRGALIVR